MSAQPRVTSQTVKQKEHHQNHPAFHSVSAQLGLFGSSPIAVYNDFIEGDSFQLS